MSLNQDVSHGFNVLVVIISSGYCLVSTRVGIINNPSGAKPDSGITDFTIIFVVTKDTDSRFDVLFRMDIKPFHVAVGL